MTAPSSLAPAAPRDRKSLRRASLWTVLRHPGALWRFLRDRDAPRLPRVMAVLALAYVVMPFDAIPDLVPLLGWLDDLGVATLALGYIASRTAGYLNEHPERPSPALVESTAAAT